MEGGLKLGEMEKDTLIAHGTSKFIRERLFESSDPFVVDICNNCGNFATTSELCNFCNNDDISRVEIPYSFKQLVHELNSMGIKFNFNLK